MNDPPMQAQRFLGMDLHKQYLVVVGVDQSKNVVLPVRRIDYQELAEWAKKNLRPNDAVVIEATTNAWHIYDQVKPLVSYVVVAHPLLVRVISSGKVKTDRLDALWLARLLAVDMVPPVWVPPPEVRELRTLVSHRQRLVRQRTQIRNRVSSVLQRYSLLPPEGDPFGASTRGWWQSLELPEGEKFLLRQNLALLDALSPLIAEADAELARQSSSSRWEKQAALLIQMTGISVQTAMVLLSAIGDISRFARSKNLVGYAGLGPGVHQSGQTDRGGPITKQGRREIRVAMVESAWIAVQYSEHWKEEFARLSARLPAGKAIVAIARKMLVVVWHVLSEQEADVQVEPEAVARKFLAWAGKAKKRGRGGLSRPAFVRRQLENVGLGETLLEFRVGRGTVRLPAPEIAPAR